MNQVLDVRPAHDEQGGVTTHGAEINIFLRTPEGFDAHLKIPVVNYLDAPKRLVELSRLLKEKEFEPQQRFAPSGGSGGGRQPRKTNTADITCKFCNSEMYDNRTTKQGKQPDYKCKNKGCDAAAWVQDSGELSWMKRQQ